MLALIDSQADQCIPAKKHCSQQVVLALNALDISALIGRWMLEHLEGVGLAPPAAGVSLGQCLGAGHAAQKLSTQCEWAVWS